MVCDVVCDKLLDVGHKAGRDLVRIRVEVNTSRRSTSCGSIPVE